MELGRKQEQAVNRSVAHAHQRQVSVRECDRLLTRNLTTLTNHQKIVNRKTSPTVNGKTLPPHPYSRKKA